MNESPLTPNQAAEMSAQTIRNFTDQMHAARPKDSRKEIRREVIRVRHLALSAFGVPRSNLSGQRLGLRQREMINYQKLTNENRKNRV